MPRYADVRDRADEDAPSRSRSRSRQRKKSAQKRRDPRWAQTLVVFGALMLMVSGVGAIGVRVLIAQAQDSVTVENLLGDSGATTSTKVPDGPLNILLIGLDHRKSTSETNSRADTVIILHIPEARNQAFLVSIPRDLMVQVKPFPDSGYRGGRAKINEAFYFGAQGNGGITGGTKLLADTIHSNPELGIEFNGAAIINFESFLKVVEELGSVYMCFDQTVVSRHIYLDAQGNPHNDPSERADLGRLGKPATYKKGECKRLEPWQALDFARQRYDLKNGDYDRQKHQLQLMKAIVKEAASKSVLTNPGKLNNIIGAAGKAFVVDTRGVPIADFVLALGGVAANDLMGLKTNAGKISGSNIDGIWFETLTPDSVLMFQALREGTLDQFLLQHPEFLAG